MRTLLFSLAVSLAVTGCARQDDTTAAAQPGSKVPTVTVDELAAMLAKHECQPVDANGAGTRAKLGVIPGAVLLSDSDTYKLSELPADKAKALVFYCANTSCGASDDAAGKAITAGYTNVKVLREGIAGWKTAGKPTASGS